MSVYKQKTKSGYYQIKFMIDGQDYTKTTKTTNKKLAEAMEAKWRTEILQSKLAGKKKLEIKLSTLIENYLALPLAENTIKNASNFFLHFKEDIDTDVNVSEFDQTEILKWVQKRMRAGIQQSTIRTQLLYLSGAWNDCNNKLYNIPDLELPTLQRSPVKTVYMNEDETDKLLDYMRTRKVRGAGAGEQKGDMEDLIIVLLQTGLRHNEVARLEWRNVDLKNKTIEVWRKKTSEPSKLRMTNRVHQVLQRRSETKKHEQWVFTNKDHTSHRRDSTTYLNELLIKAGVKITTHGLRHTFASNLLNNAGFTLPQVGELLAHKSLESTRRYAHLEKNTTAEKAVDFLNEQQAERARANLKVVK